MMPVTADATLTLSVIIVSYNTCEMTLACLESLAGETHVPHEVIVFDNNSKDGSVEEIRVRFPAVRLIAHPENVGFARANNMAVELARAKHILLLNPDTVVLDRAVDRLIAFAERRPKAGIWGGRTLFADGSLNPTSCHGRPTLWRQISRTIGLALLFSKSEFFNGEGIGGWQRDTERPVEIVTGCFLLITRSLWDALGGFDSAFFMYGEDADLCLRAAKLGACPFLTPDATIVHYVGASSVDLPSKAVRLLAGRITLINRHFPSWQRPLGRILVVSWPLLRVIRLGVLSLFNKRRLIARNYWLETWRRREEWRNGYQQ